jgi:hypothetical protein
MELINLRWQLLGMVQYWHVFENTGVVESGNFTVLSFAKFISMISLEHAQTEENIHIILGASCKGKGG